MQKSLVSEAIFVDEGTSQGEEDDFVNKNIQWSKLLRYTFPFFKCVVKQGKKGFLA